MSRWQAPLLSSKELEQLRSHKYSCQSLSLVEPHLQVIIILIIIILVVILIIFAVVIFIFIMMLDFGPTGLTSGQWPVIDQPLPIYVRSIQTFDQTFLVFWPFFA